MSFKRFILNVADRQWPPKTDEERSEYYARRAAFLATPEPLSHVLLRAAAVGLAFLAIPFVYWWASA